MSDPQAFYDTLADSYHLIFEDWDRSIARQGDALAAILTERWPLTDRQVLDAAVGIGTQALGLAARGFRMIGADLSTRAVAEQEWHWQGPTYRLVLRVRPVDEDTGNVVEAATTYFAVPIRDILGLLSDVGLRDVRRLDGPFYQPLLVGTVPAS